jgi:glucan phosphoethanolaminetransferase (alkaline phosphatase superfamily)
MKILRRIARPCGIAGGIWAILFAIFLSLIAPIRGVTAPAQHATNTIESVAWGTVAIIVIMFLLGILELVGLMLSRRNPRLNRIFKWVSSLGMLVLSLALMFFFLSPSGLILFPAAILLILAAVGMRETGRVPLQEAT